MSNATLAQFYSDMAIIKKRESEPKSKYLIVSEERVARHSRMVGERCGRLEVIEITNECPIGYSDLVIVCKCDCGKKHRMRRSNFCTGSTKSCGCLMRELRMKHKKGE